MEKKDRIYRVHVTEINPADGTQKDIMDERFTGFAMTADCGDGKCCEVIVNDTILDVATRIASGEKISKAARLAAVMMKMKAHLDANEAEDALLRAIMED
jgi:hypothetical protein